MPVADSFELVKRLPSSFHKGIESFLKLMLKYFQDMEIKKIKFVKLHAEKNAKYFPSTMCIYDLNK